MRTGSACLDEAPVLNDFTTAVYRYATHKGYIDSIDTAAEHLDLNCTQVRTAIDRLAENRLLRTELNGAERAYVPVDPKLAAALLVSPMEQEIYQRKELIAQVNEWTDAFGQDYAQAVGPTMEQGLCVQPVSGALEVRGYLRTAADACREEVLVMHDGTNGSDALNDFAVVCLELLERGVSVRVLCQHRNRADMVARTTMKKLLDAGATVRTACRVPRNAVVVDRSLSVLLGTGEDDDLTASRVCDEELVGFLNDMFEHLWDLALPLHRVDIGYADVTGDLHRTIASLMAKGFTDEVLARRLGMSVRTCRRHIADLMRTLGAVSRFQAGFCAADQGLLREA
jgi:transcription initiation factor IIE alpha subunit